MLSKKECKRALENMHSQVDIETQWYSYDILKKLIDEHFKLKGKYSKILDDVHDYRFETHCMKMTIRNLCEHFGVKNEKELQNIYLNNNLDEVIEIQKNNLTDSYMIGLYNGLVTAKAILLNNNDNIKLVDNTIYPYKFEDLKEGMWVWDDVAKECLYVIKFFAAPFTGAKYFSYLGIYKNLEEIKKLDIKFEENRFFPVQCANLES
ncbi:hypothetical protein [Thomasclavelia ramosa]|uniref:hypothetical protein n=1 Tax=Thomasclavelia ramosa TaxID=1547 RepID=UPI0022E4171E|nr:hypothetical protein [Thomasclavelia ramosa]